MDFKVLEKDVNKIIDSDFDVREKLLKICELLKEKVSHYDWVGFYLVDKDKRLALGPFVGGDTEHKLIEFGSGICGQAAELEKTFVVQDVSKEKNYLSCSPKVASEIVVPIFKNGKIIGEIDIDSHSTSPFTHYDKEFLERVAKRVSSIL